ncbi:MAG: P-loop NTPase family protein [Sulfuricaulis sp.]
MSKIEEALKKIRAQGNEGAQKGMIDTRRQLVKSADPSLESRPQHQIVRMSEPRSLSKTELINSRIIFPAMDDTEVVNAFREARTKILQATGGRNCSILVTSVSNTAGCSFVALNLAVAFTFDEARTALLMDCNIQHPAYHELMTGNPGPGLGDYLEDETIRVDQIIHPVGIPRLRIIPAGREPTPDREYFTSQRMLQLLKGVRERYPDRYVIMDSPPIMEAADTRILAEVSDYVLLVVPYGRSTEVQIAAAVKAIGKQKLLGIIFNDEPRLPKLLRLGRRQAGSAGS